LKVLPLTGDMYDVDHLYLEGHNPLALLGVLSPESGQAFLRDLRDLCGLRDLCDLRGLRDLRVGIV